MDIKRFFSYRFLIILLATVVMACQQKSEVESFELTIRLPNEPENIHPIFSKSLHAAPIEGLILMPLAEYDPLLLKLSPLLITDIPVGEDVKEGKHAGGKVFRFAFRPEAVWTDGKPVTGEDYLFTLKAVYNPHVNAQSWRSFMEFISEVVVDPSDPKKVAVYFDSTYILDLDATTNFNIYPAHFFDQENIMSSFSLDELRDPNKQWTTAQDSLLKRFAVLFESPEFLREKVTGNGPYELDQWMTGEFIRLKRKENWWGDQLKDPPTLMHGYPTAITYKIILDAAAAEAAIKAGEIDLMAEVPVSAFKRLESDAQWKDKLQFASPEQMQVNSLELNTRDSILHDVRIRKALALSLDYDGMLQTIMQGMAERAVGPIHPRNIYFNKSLTPVRQDLNAALALIREAGWSDSNENGIPDKMIGGKRTELKLEIKTTNKEEGLAISNILKENARKAGFDISIVIVDPTQLNQDVKQHNFMITPLRTRSFPTEYDPYVLWHSENAGPGGTNRSGYQNPQLDKLIDDLRVSVDTEEKATLFNSFQQLVYDEQPSIFLYIPKERIIATKRISMITSVRRPGYFENLIQPAGQ